MRDHRFNFVFNLYVLCINRGKQDCLHLHKLFWHWVSCFEIVGHHNSVQFFVCVLHFLEQDSVVKWHLPGFFRCNLVVKLAIKHFLLIFEFFRLALTCFSVCRNCPIQTKSNARYHFVTLGIIDCDFNHYFVVLQCSRVLKLAFNFGLSFTEDTKAACYFSFRFSSY